MAATAFFALMPALQATRIEPVRTLRGELVKDARPGRARNALIGIQVFASALLLICAAIFLRSAIASSRFDPGFRTADTVIIDIINEPKRAAMLQAIASESTITAYAARTARTCWRGRATPSRRSARAGRRSPTSSSRPSTSTCSAFRSCAGDRSPRRSATATIRSSSSRNRSRASCGRMATASAKRSGSSRISTPNRSRETNRRCRRAWSRWWACRARSPGFRFTDVKDAGCSCRPASTRRRRRSWRASAAIPSSPAARSSITSPGSIRTWA